MLHDSSLSFSARLIYSELALWVFHGNTTARGVRLIAKDLGMSKTTVANGIAELVAAGAVTREAGGKPGYRAIYSLPSGIFGRTQPKPARCKEPRKLAACRSCARLTVKLSKDALCRPCVNAAELERRVREARAQLGADATPEQISAHLKTADATSQVRRTLRSIREVA